MVKKIQKNETNKAEDINDETLEVPTILSLLENDDNVMSDVQKDILEEEIAELPPIKEGLLNISGIYAYDMGEKFEVKVYIRNASLDEVVLENVPLIITNSKNEVLAQQTFNLKSLGTIPPQGARPLKVYFEKKNVYVEKIPMDDWEIAFDARVRAVRKVDVDYEKLPRNIELEDKLVFDKFLRGLPDLKEGDFSISTFSMGIEKNGNIMVTVVMRNGDIESRGIKKIPVTVIDNKGNPVKSNLFELGDFQVGGRKARIFNFSFPTNLKLEENISLNDWKVEFRLQELAKESSNKEENIEK